MKTKLILTVLIVLCAWSASFAQYPERYMGQSDAKVAAAPNGAVIYAKSLEDTSKNIYTKPTVERIADGIWSIGGYSIANCTVIEAV